MAVTVDFNFIPNRANRTLRPRTCQQIDSRLSPINPSYLQFIRFIHKRIRTNGRFKYVFINGVRFLFYYYPPSNYFLSLETRIKLMENINVGEGELYIIYSRTRGLSIFSGRKSSVNLSLKTIMKKVPN